MTQMVPPDVIDRMTQGCRSFVTGVQGARGLSHLYSRQRKTPLRHVEWHRWRELRS